MTVHCAGGSDCGAHGADSGKKWRWWASNIKLVVNAIDNFPMRTKSNFFGHVAPSLAPVCVIVALVD